MSKSASKSSRTSTLVEQLDRLVAAAQAGAAKDVEQLRHVTLKLYQLLQNPERGKKDATKAFLEKVKFFLELLENFYDAQLSLNILSCLLELASGGKKTVSSLVSSGTIDVVLKVLKSASSDVSSNEEILVLTHSILARIGNKDRKFALKTRLTGSLQVTLDVIRQNCSNFKVLHPALLVLKLSAGSSVNCSVLNKAVFVSVLFKILPNCGHKRNTTLKLVLDLISTLLKSKSAAVKAVNLNAVEILLRMFYDWHRNDHHNRQTGVRKALLNSLKALVCTKAGKAAFVQSDGFKTLFYFGTDTFECKELDGLNNVVVQILRLCMPNTAIPVTNANATVVFHLPNMTMSSGTEKDDEEDEKDSDEDESSPLDSEEDEEERVTESQDDSETTTEKETTSSSTENKHEGRTREELCAMYDHFFPENNLFKDIDEECDAEVTVSNQQAPIVIPTADMEGLSPSSSANDLLNRGSMPAATACDDTGSRNVTGSRDDTGSREDLKSTTADPNDCTVDEKFKIRSVKQFVGIPSPDVYGHYPPLHPETLNPKKTGTQRLMLLKNVERVIQSQKLINNVVYDLDCEEMTEDDEGCLGTQATKGSCTSDVPDMNTSDNERHAQASAADQKQSLLFESRFECGNLRKAIQISETEYDLILSSDVNCTSHHQWFYFEVSNMDENVPYKFNIINCEKVNSQFNFGMQPVLYSCKDAENGDPGWVRVGSNICYYKNHYKRSAKNEKEKYHYTLTFTVQFPYSKDRCFLAYHYPYSFSLLENHFMLYERRMNSSKIFYKRQTLCSTLTGNPCYVVTITSPSSRNNNRPYIFLCSRVHPGESNASWVMKGVLDFLLSNKMTAKLLREMFIFKIIPMLNPDGVINGCHRCSLSGHDLNRQWIEPDAVTFPTIYHTKGLLLYLKAMDRKPFVFCDFHGHSRKKNVFLYGCHNATEDLPVNIAVSESESDCSYASETIKDTSHKTLPRILHSIAPAFSLQNCSYNVDPSKESTARVVVWREFGIVRSYTMESTYCGADQGPYKGCHLGTKELEEMGRCFCAGLLKLGDSDSVTRLLGTVSKSALGEQSADEEFLFSNGDLFAPVDTFPYEGQDYATQLLV